MLKNVRILDIVYFIKKNYKLEGGLFFSMKAALYARVSMKEEA